MSERVDEGKPENGPDEVKSGPGISVPPFPHLDTQGLTPMLEATSGRVQDVLRATDQAAEDIIRGAQADAQRYVEEARQRAERLTHDRMDRIASLTEDLMAQAGTIHRQAQDLRAALSQTLTKLSDELGLEPPLTPEPAGASVPAVAAEPSAPEPAAFLADQSSAEMTAAEPTAPEPDPAPLVSEAQPLAAVQDLPDASGDEAPSLLGRLSRRRRRGEGGPVSIDEARIATVQMLASGETREVIEQRLRDEFGIDDASEIFSPGEPSSR